MIVHGPSGEEVPSCVLVGRFTAPEVCALLTRQAHDALECAEWYRVEATRGFPGMVNVADRLTRRAAVLLTDAAYLAGIEEESACRP